MLPYKYVVKKKTTIFEGGIVVGIIALKGSPVDLINVGLTAREYIKDGRRVRFQFIGEEELSRFWKRPQDYADPEDKMLVIINLPVPDINKLKNMESSAWEAAIVYVPSKLVSLDREKRNVLLEKGISCIPQREPYLCFAGDFAEGVDEFWMTIGKIVSLEDIPEQFDEKLSQIIRGLLMSTDMNPQRAVESISENNIDYFTGLAKKELPVEVHVMDGDAIVEVVIDGKSGILPHIACEAFDAFLRTRRTSIGVCGTNESVLFTIKPTHTRVLLKRCNMTGDVFYRFGKGAIFTVSDKHPTHLGVLVGRDARRYILLKFDEPKFVNYRTLRRRLIGGKTVFRAKDKVYRKRYRGLKDKYPEIKLLGRNLLEVPQDSFEMVLDALRECGARFKLLE